MANLINFGILPLVFKDKEDYDFIDEMDELMIEDTSKLYETDEIKVYDKTKDKYFTALTSLSNEDVDILMASGALNYIKDQQ